MIGRALRIRKEANNMVGSWFHSMRSFWSEWPRPTRTNWQLRPFQGRTLQILEDRCTPAVTPGPPTMITVTTLADVSIPTDGVTSLREAITTAQNSSGDDTILFDPQLFSTGPQTISLGKGALTYNSSIGTDTIVGPGADLLRISGNFSSNVFTNLSGTLVLSGLTIGDGQTSSGNGGGILNFATVILLDSSLENNTTNSFSSSGGAIFNSGTLLIQDSSFLNNQSGAGGAIANIGSATIINSTFTGNQSFNRGGAIYNNGTMELRNVTIAYNQSGTITSGLGGGLYTDFSSESATTTLFNSIVANNVRNPGSIASDVEGVDLKVESANNIIADALSSGGLINGTNGNQVGVDPKLSPLGYYGGATQTFLLLGDSPAIDAGNDAFARDFNDSPLLTDQRGVARRQGAAVDIGAVETVVAPVAPVAPVIEPAPFLIPSRQRTTYTENDPLTPIDPDAILFLNPSGLPPLAFHVEGFGLVPGDLLFIRDEGTAPGQVGVLGNWLTYSGNLIATFTGGGTDPLEVDFVANVTLEQVQAVLRNISFASLSEDPPTDPRLVRITIVDATGNELDVAYFIDVINVNDAPTLLPIEDRFALVGREIAFQASAQDLDGDNLRFTLEPGSPLGATIDPVTGVIRWIPLQPGIFNLTVRVEDDGSPAESSLQSFRIFVLMPGQPLPLKPGTDFSDGRFPFFSENSFRPGDRPNEREQGDRVEGRPESESGRRNERPPERPMGMGGMGSGSDARAGVSSGGELRGSRGNQPLAAEIRVEKSTFQLVGRSVVSPENLVGSIKPLVTPGAAITSFFDSDDSVELIEDLRRDTSPIFTAMNEPTQVRKTVEIIGVIDTESPSEAVPLSEVIPSASPFPVTIPTNETMISPVSPEETPPTRWSAWVITLLGVLTLVPFSKRIKRRILATDEDGSKNTLATDKTNSECGVRNVE